MSRADREARDAVIIAKLAVGAKAKDLSIEFGISRERIYQIWGQMHGRRQSLSSAVAGQSSASRHEP